MKKRMVSCKHCGEKARPDDERCPYCNKKLEVDYASLYPAYPNKKYYLHISSRKSFKVTWMLFYVFYIVLVIAMTALVTVAFYRPNRPWWILGVPYILFFIFLLAILCISAHLQFSGYMIWDGKDTVTVKKAKSPRSFSISSVEYIVPHIINNSRRGTSVYIAVTKEDEPLFYVHANEFTADFFNHFGIMIRTYEADRFENYDPDMLK